jgi:hypothetical protein
MGIESLEKLEALKRSKQGANEPGAELALREPVSLYLTDPDNPSENESPLSSLLTPHS